MLHVNVPPQSRCGCTQEWEQRDNAARFHTIQRMQRYNGVKCWPYLKRLARKINITPMPLAATDAARHERGSALAALARS